MSKTREIIHRYFNSRHSEDARQQFASWFNAPANHAEKEAVLREIWDGLEVKPDTSTGKSYEALLSAIRTTDQKAPRKRFTLQKFCRIAAMFMLPILSAAITYFIMRDYKPTGNEISLVECIVPNGEIRTVILPDSSVVKINSGSILIYPRQFTGKRDVFLNGEAYFTVSKDESKPFIVKTTDMEVEVLGTVFNLSSYTDSETSSTALQSGKVNVRFRDTSKKPVLLKPNEQVTYNRSSGAVEKSTIKIEQAIAWTQGNLVIQSMPIDQIAQIIERKFALKVNLNLSRYKNERITMRTAQGESVTDFMSVLSYLIPQLKYNIEGDTLFIY